MDMNKMISKLGSAIVSVTVFLFAIFLLIQILKRATALISG
jgi:hypothetical protein